MSESNNPVSISQNNHQTLKVQSLILKRQTSVLKERLIHIKKQALLLKEQQQVLKEQTLILKMKIYIPEESSTKEVEDINNPDLTLQGNHG